MPQDFGQEVQVNFKDVVARLSDPRYTEAMGREKQKWVTADRATEPGYVLRTESPTLSWRVGMVDEISRREDGTTVNSAEIPGGMQVQEAREVWDGGERTTLRYSDGYTYSRLEDRKKAASVTTVIDADGTMRQSTTTKEAVARSNAWSPFLEANTPAARKFFELSTGFGGEIREEVATNPDGNLSQRVLMAGNTEFQGPADRYQTKRTEYVLSGGKEDLKIGIADHRIALTPEPEMRSVTV